MKTGKIILSATLILMVSCKSQVNHSEEKINQIENEIKQLETVSAKRTYLETIWEDDQAVRDNEKSSELMLKYGKDSDEYMGYIKNQWSQDEINLIKVEKYLEFYGYPDKEFGDKATTTPWLVIHHAQGYEARERNFEKVYEAYLKGDIDNVAISFYLGRMYEMKEGERLVMESPYTAEDEINRLINKLNLNEKKLNAQQSIARHKQ